MPDFPSSVLVTLLATLLGGGGLVAFLLWPAQREQVAVRTLREALEIVAQERDHHLQQCADAMEKYEKCRTRKRALEALCLEHGVPFEAIRTAVNPHD